MSIRGLDISAYRCIHKAPPDWGAEDSKMNAYTVLVSDGVLDWVNKEFPGRAEGIKAGLYTQGQDSLNFRAGSYGDYNRWREWLAKVAGWKDIQEAWAKDADPRQHGAFFELINFADNEGVIGPVCAKKLALDFSLNRQRAMSMSNDAGADMDLYDLFHMAFKLASAGGFVQFH